MAIPLVEGGIKETIDRQNNIITDESAQCTILPHQLKHMSAYNKVLCGCECWISSKGMHFYLLPWREHYLKKLKTRVITHTIEGLVVWKFVFLKPKRMLWGHMGIISTKRHQLWPWKKYPPSHLINMCCPTGSMCYEIVTNIEVFSYPVKNWTNMKLKTCPTIIFMTTYYYQAILWKE